MAREDIAEGVSPRVPEYSKLTDAKVSTLRIGEGTMWVKYGFVSDSNGGGKPVYFFEKGQDVPKGVTLLDESGHRITTITTEPLSFSRVKHIFMGGKRYRLYRDAWCNPVLNSEMVELNHQSLTVFEEVTQLWQKAIESPQELDNYVKEKLGEEGFEEINRLINFLKIHPEIQAVSGDIDLWDLANLRKEVAQKVLEISLFECYGQVGGEIVQRVMTIVDKIGSGQKLDKEEELWVSALESKKLANMRHSGNPGRRVEITDFNERYAKANLVEGILAERLLPEQVFGLHRDNYREFKDLLLDKAGVNLPSWFESYKGDEFRFGLSFIGTRAEANDLYVYFGLEGLSPEVLARVIDHERIHTLEWLAGNLGTNSLVKEKKDKGIESGETFTETLSLLISAKGDVATASTRNDETRCMYSTGVAELLKIVQEINEQSKDELQGTVLLVQGITGLSEGQVVKNLGPIESYYDKYVAPLREGSTFAHRMEPYSDKHFFLGETIIMDWLPSRLGNLPKDKIAEALVGLSVDDLPEAIKEGLGMEYDRDYYQSTVEGSKDEFIKNPYYALGRLYPMDVEDKLGRAIKTSILDKIKASPEAAQQMQAYVDEDYQKYAEWLQKGLEEVKKKGEGVEILASSV